MQIINNKILILSFVAVLSGCISPGKNLIPEEGPSMDEIYRDNMAGSHTEQLSLIREEVAPLSPFALPAINYSDYTRTAENEINHQFPRLPNPDLQMYVYPHLAAADNAPVPGYSTVFPLYNRVHYALPGEPHVASQ